MQKKAVTRKTGVICRIPPAVKKGTTQAAAMRSHWKPVSEVLQLTNKAVTEALDGLPAHKLHCSVLAEEAIQAAINDYKSKQKIRAVGMLAKAEESK